jgi:cell division protein FtsZ
MGKAMMGTGEASGEGRAVAAAEAAIANPLIDDVSLKGAKGLIINITGGKDITLYEVDEAANRIKEEVDDEANIIYGTTCDERLEGLVRVSIVATGIDSNIGTNAKPLENFAPININNELYKSDQTQYDDSQITNSLSDQNDDQIDISSDLVANEETMYSAEADENSETDIKEIFQDDGVNEEDGNLNSNSLDSTDINVTPSEEESLDKNEVISAQNENSFENSKEETVSEEPSVRRLSLFDNISSNISEEDTKEESLKAEPVISTNISNIEEVETLETTDKDEEIEPEYNVSDDELNEEYNQETEEELLDIPTFLRRQAN